MSGFFSRLLPGRQAPSPACHPPFRPEPAGGSGLSEFFVSDHRDCDALWAAVEAAVEAGEDPAESLARFAGSLRTHLAMEEEVLFPAMEEAGLLPRGMGPLMVMRSEHEMMRRLLEQMEAASGPRELIRLGDTLLMVIQQHNAKEEGIVYPRADDGLGAGWESLRAELERVQA